MKLIDAKRILLQEAASTGTIGKNFLESYGGDQQKMLFLALK